MLFAFCILLVLSGCSAADHKDYNAMRMGAPELIRVLPQPIPLTAKFLSYTEDGRHFLVTNNPNKVEVYSTAPLAPVASFEWLTSSQMNGASFVGNNAYYYAGAIHSEARYARSVYIWQLEPPLKLFSYDFIDGADNRIFANANYVAYEEQMVNWHTGEKYLVRGAHPSPAGYTLTASGKVLSYNWQNGYILLHNPIDDTSLSWDSGSSSMDIAITPNERFVIAQSHDGACRVWPVPALKPVKTCGNGTWFDEKPVLIALHPADDSFAVSWGGRVELYRPVAGEGHQRVFSLMLPSEVTTLALSANNRLAMSDSTGHIEVWDSHTGILLGRTQLELKYGSRALTFAPSGKQLLYGEGNEKIHLFDIPD